ncbi:MAG: T9SS type A sorting domain-containing protein, partial [Pricia sp.]|nr:T9SS type A sorting domain-containing protein [Pricia sp.]
LIDPVTDTPLFDLTDDMVISLADIPSTFLAIRANTNDNVNSVRLELRGTQIGLYFDDIEPYALPSDVPIGDYRGQNFSLGSFTITGIPYLGNDHDSPTGTPLSVSFEIVESVSSGKHTRDMLIAPNPVASSTTLSFQKPVQLSKIEVFDILGRLECDYKGSDVFDGNVYILNTTDLKSGTYFIVSHDVIGKSYHKQIMVKN